MARRRFTLKQLIVGLAAAASLASAGCFAHQQGAIVPPPGVPTELSPVTLPPYVIAPPDVLLIDVYFDPMDPTKKPVALYPQPISGQHLVRPDGTVYLGVWGSVPLTGLSLDQASEAVRQHVFNKMQTDKRIGDRMKAGSPDRLFVTVDVMAYNSKMFYIVTDGAGFGEQIFPFPCTGNDFVLDALSKINGLPYVASKRDIWVARRCPIPAMPDQILPVDYIAMTQQGATCTNYQIFPGDRIYVKAQRILTFDRFLQKVLTPVERILGITLLGSSTVNSIRTGGTSSGGGGVP